MLERITELLQVNWDALWEYIFLYDQAAPMLFNSQLFLLIFAIFLACYLVLAPRKYLRISFTVAFSLFFYYKTSGIYFVLLIWSTIVDYLIGRLMDLVDERWTRRLLLFTSIAANLGVLGYFKYTNFFLENLSLATGSQLGPFDIFLPVGISFYTFQTISYAIDVYRGKLKPCKNILDFAFYVSFFPQLVAGPIVRAVDFIPQIGKRLFLSRQDLGKAVLLISGGLFKKAVISDYISVNFVDRVFDAPLLYNGLENWLAMYAYAVQIYCDFSGYSDMAIGLALLLGFKLPDNFLSPYKATNIRDFWRRWHISLSTWLRDYLYVSMGGNRKGRVRTYLHLLITMLLGGLWHGASWNFVLWGGLHGSCLVIDRFIRNRIDIPKGFGWKLAGWLISFNLVCFAWVLFRADGFDKAGQMYHQMFMSGGLMALPKVVLAYWKPLGLVILAMILHLLPERLEKTYLRFIQALPWPVLAVYLSMIMWMVIQMQGAAIQPFIYFQF